MVELCKIPMEQREKMSAGGKEQTGVTIMEKLMKQPVE